jgi:hypothetical protein
MELKILLGVSACERDGATNRDSWSKDKVPLHTTYGGVKLKLHAVLTSTWAGSDFTTRKPLNLRGKRPPVKVKEKFTIEQTTKVQSGVYSSTLPSISVPDEGWWSTLHTGRFTPVKNLIPIVQKAGWAPGRSRSVRKISPPPGFVPLDRPNCSELLYWPRYSGP